MRLFANTVTCLIFYAVIWLAFLLENLMHFRIGIFPREFTLENLVGIPFSWLSHVNYAHIAGNSMGFLPILIAMIIVERDLMKTLCTLALASGVATWLLGGAHTFHLGASGLIFASIGYICFSALSRPGYFFALIFAGFYYGLGYFTTIFSGFVPHGDMSVAGHLGGFIAGIIVSIRQKIVPVIPIRIE